MFAGDQVLLRTAAFPLTFIKPEDSVTLAARAQASIRLQLSPNSSPNSILPVPFLSLFTQDVFHSSIQHTQLRVNPNRLGQQSRQASLPACPPSLLNIAASGRPCSLPVGSPCPAPSVGQRPCPTPLCHHLPFPAPDPPPPPPPQGPCPLFLLTCSLPTCSTFTSAPFPDLPSSSRELLAPLLPCPTTLLVLKGTSSLT